MYYLELHHKDADTVEFENLEEFESLIEALSEARVPFDAYEDCPECNGEGDFENFEYSGTPDHTHVGTVSWTCENCNGEGKIEF